MGGRRLEEEVGEGGIKDERKKEDDDGRMDKKDREE